MEIEIIAEGLKFPEGPVFMPDGSVIVVEVAGQTLTRCWNGKTEIVAHIKGGPNGAALGPDGAIYVTNNGGFDWGENGRFSGLAAKDYTTGSIERVDLSTGKVERLYESVNGHRLSGPNDLVFDKAGGIYFTDLGKGFARHKDFGGLYYCRPDGSHIAELSYGSTGLNGVGLSPDEKTVYAAETATARLFAWEITSPGKIKETPFGQGVLAAPGGHIYFDSMAVQANGNICVATIMVGVTTISPQGSSTQTRFPDMFTTNICFGGADMRDAYLTFSGTGKLAKVRWPTPGLKLNFASY